MSVSLESLRALPIADKLQLVEQLWDDIAAGSETFPWSEWLQAETLHRAAELELHPEIALTREELWKQVDQAREP